MITIENILRFFENIYRSSPIVLFFSKFFFKIFFSFNYFSTRKKNTISTYYLI